jgi:hypothetical protein
MAAFPKVTFEYGKQGVKAISIRPGPMAGASGA